MLKVCAVTCVLLVATVDGGYYRRRYWHQPPPSSQCPQPSVYLQQGSFTDLEAFYEALDESLQDTHCGSLDAYRQSYRCLPYSYDPTFYDILNYLRTACKFNYSKSSYLTTLLETYCDYHCPVSDDRVAEAYQCATRCGLADHLNQFCNDKAAALAMEPEVTCPANYSLFNVTGTCYQYVSDEDDFFAASMSCEQMGGQLVQIDSEEENQFVFELIMNNTNSARVWIGLNDVLSEGNFTWATSYDTPIYFNWGPNQPNTDVPNPSDCVVINYNSDGNNVDAKWNDVRDCDSREQPYVCERNPVTM